MKTFSISSFIDTLNWKNLSNSTNKYDIWKYPI